MIPESGAKPGKIRVIGVGDEFRGDDAAGRWVARKIREINLPGVEVLEAGGAAGHLMELWQGSALAMLIDAMHSGAPPGTVRRFDAVRKPLPAQYFPSHSTHAFGVMEAVELARTLGQLPPCLIVYGIEGASFEAGAGLSREAALGAQEALSRVLEDLKQLTGQCG
jgi:hydrogenase maturation protease